MSAKHGDAAQGDLELLEVPEDIEGRDFAERAGRKLGEMVFDE